MINTANLLLVTDTALLGSQRYVRIENIQGLPAAVDTGSVLRAEVIGTDGKQSTLQLADGTTIKADITPQLPIGSRLTLLTQPDNTASLLRYLAPPRRDAEPAPGQPQTAGTSQSQQPAAQQQSTQPSQLPPQTPLIQIAVKLPTAEGKSPLPQVGASLPLNVEPGKPVPAVGATVLGQITGEPENGVQTLELTNKTRLQVPVPPIFPPRTEVQLKILSPTAARIERLNTPVLANLVPQAAEKTAQQQVSEPQPSTASQPALPQPLASGVRPLQPLPTALVQQAAPGQAAVLEATILPAEEGQPPQVANLRLPDGQTVKINTPTPLQEGQTVAIRIRADGLVDILPVTQSSAPKAINRNDTSPQQGQGQGTQTPQQDTKQPQPGQTVLAQATVNQRVDSATYQLKFDNGLTVQVHSERPLHVGAQLSVRLLPDGHAEILNMALPKAANPKAAGLLNFSLGWSNLTKAIQSLQANHPDALADLKDRLPTLDDTALPNLMRFAEAVTTRNLEVLFGKDTLNILRALGLDGALSNDMNSLHTLHQKAPENQQDMWRGMVFPYWNEEDDQPRQGQFFWRNQRDDHGGSDREHVRFVVNFSLSKMGSLQLDGLVRERDMQLKLRTVEPLTEPEADGLYKVVQKALVDAGMTGSIDVEGVTHFEVDPVHDIVATQKNLDLSI
ncbi:MAG: hypothetical protein GC134_05060 [Proteobacteria bacterium]|nr:hypothetical protein [Pseudomonadota bacterium]